MRVPPPPRQKVCKVFESETLGLDLGCHQVALVLVLNLFLQYVCQVNQDIKTIEIGFQSVSFGISVVEDKPLESYCEITIWEVLVMVQVLSGTNGTARGKLYVIVT